MRPSDAPLLVHPLAPRTSYSRAVELNRPQIQGPGALGAWEPGTLGPWEPELRPRLSAASEPWSDLLIRMIGPMILLMIEVLHDLIYQSSMSDGNYSTLQFI